MPDAQQLYISSIRDMPIEERLRLAALILNDLTQPGVFTEDFKDAWTEEDLRDLTIYSMRRAEEEYPHEDGLVVGDDLTND